VKCILIAMIGALLAATANAAPVTYAIDPNHTFPSFETDHMGGMSVWRGKFRSTSGNVILDAAAQTGTVNIVVDASSIDFGLDKLNEHVKSAAMLDATKYPTATYIGKLTKFVEGAPTQVDGELTLHGITKPLTLTIRSFKCAINPIHKTETCGADAAGMFNRDDYGIDFGKAMGFKMPVALAIQVEAAKPPP
jgi:polyisoprenoid-binding protein YceI